MNDREHAAFSHDAITEYYKEVARYSFWFDAGDESVKIHVIIKETDRGMYTYSTSHMIQTPMQAGPYSSSRRTMDTPEAALNKAIDDLTSFYNGAVSKGHNPSAKWFVESETFKDSY